MNGSTSLSEIAEGRRFVEGDADAGGGDGAEVGAAGAGGVDQPRQRPRLDLDAQGVEVRRMDDAVAQPAERGREQHGEGVHTLLVAFSRRMCCSRVCSAIRSAGRPAASWDTPMMRPGRWRLYSSRVAKNAACGPP